MMTHISEIWDAKICILWMNNYGEYKMINLSIINGLSIIVYKTKNHILEIHIGSRCEMAKVGTVDVS